MPYCTDLTINNSSIEISPANPTILAGGTVQFSAICKDQSGNPITCPSAPTWSITDATKGSIDPNTGLFTANYFTNTPNTVTVQATVGSVTGSTLTTIVITAALSNLGWAYFHVGHVDYLSNCTLDLLDLPSGSAAISFNLDIEGISSTQTATVFYTVSYNKDGTLNTIDHGVTLLPGPGTKLISDLLNQAPFTTGSYNNLNVTVTNITVS